MKVVATYSIKGGVGKTAAAVNVAFAAAQRGQRTLLWDLDPQGAASYCFRVRPKVKGGAKALVREKRELEDVIKSSEYAGLDVVPADFSYRHLDLVLDDMKKPTRRLRRLLRGVADDYDWVVLDCPPSISLASESVIEAADALVVPVIPAPLSLRTLDQLASFVQRAAPTTRLLPFVSMMDRRKRLHRETVEALGDKWPDLLTTTIALSSAVERITVEQAPVATFAPRSASAAAFDELWLEIARRI